MSEFIMGDVLKPDILSHPNIPKPFPENKIPYVKLEDLAEAAESAMSPPITKKDNL